MTVPRLGSRASAVPGRRGARRLRSAGRRSQPRGAPQRIECRSLGVPAGHDQAGRSPAGWSRIDGRRRVGSGCRSRAHDLHEADDGAARVLRLDRADEPGVRPAGDEPAHLRRLVAADVTPVASACRARSAAPPTPVHTLQATTATSTTRGGDDRADPPAAAARRGAAVPLVERRGARAHASSRTAGEVDSVVLRGYWRTDVLRSAARGDAVALPVGRGRRQRGDARASWASSRSCFVTLVTVLLIVDMMRRIRRVRYRGECGGASRPRRRPSAASS